MKRLFQLATALAIAASVSAGLIGCGSGNGPTNGKDENWPTFTLAWSEYPSWSVFGVAQDRGLITGKRDKPGTLEKKWKVIIDLKQVDYDTCMTMYGSNTVDATCMTNMDSLNPTLGRPGTAIMPTSTSFGADACVAVGIETPEDLKGVEVYGLEKSVSEYAFVRGLQKKGLNPADYKFKNMDPGAAAQAMQTGQKNVRAIMVWNPFVLQTLRTKQDAKRLFDSSLIPGEIVDMVVVATDSLKKDGGDKFANCVCDTFYEVNKMMADPATADATYVALGSRFSNLNAADMRQCCKETKFYATPAAGIEVFTSAEFRDVNKRVADFCVERKIVTKAPDLGYDYPSKQLNFDPTYMRAVLSK